MPDALKHALTLLPWSQPLAPMAAAWLAEQGGWDQNGPLDLGGWLMVVPTRRAGRCLREALAELAATRGQAAFPPRVIMPESLPGQVAELRLVATRTQASVAWVRVLQQVKLAAYRAVVPIDPPKRDFAWARALAGRLMRVQRELADEGLRMAEVGAQENFPETERWRQLGHLEAEFDAVLAGEGLVSRAQAERDGLDRVRVPSWCRRVVVVGAPDLPVVPRRYLQTVEDKGVRVDVLVSAAELDRDSFDAWGRPMSEQWCGRALELPDFNAQVWVLVNPAEQARHIAQITRMAPRPDEWLTVAVADPEVMAPLELELKEAGVPYYNPEGEPWRRGALQGLLNGLGALVSSVSAATVGGVLRHPDVLRYWADGGIEGFAADKLLRQWDRMRPEHLAVDLDAALDQSRVAWPLLHQSLKVLKGWRERLNTGSLAESALAVPAEVYARRSMAVGEALVESARHWAESVAATEVAARLHPGLSRADWWQMALEGFAEGARFGLKSLDAVELGGWLELLWTDAPRLVVAGANEGRLPESVAGDAFLPENLRELLGLKTNAQREARDSYMLATACAMRPAAGALQLLVGKTTAAGDPLRPSRLLLAATDAELPGRVGHLFRPVESSQANLPWRRAWRLRPRLVDTPLAAVSVTALRDWLECPFRFYLRRVLKMEAQELAKAELDALDFGILMHAALEAMGQDTRLRDSADEAVLREGLVHGFDRKARELYGNEPSLPLVIQLESGRQRLRRAAAVQAGLRAEGWCIEEVETSWAVPIGGLTVRGKIDRIDRHPDGRVRVIDYKTSDRPVSPIEAHLGTMRDEDADRPEWLQVERLGRTKRWVDLQLPLYRRALVESHGREVECAYFNLPKAVGETSLEQWPEDEPELQSAAEYCAEQVAVAIAAGHYWPPVEAPGKGRDEWAGLFHHGMAASVAEDWIRERTGA
ncbi:MAG: PD-(D/E)XK nuclease family protein [Candidatus Synoicihabitans palmerolidicus]|nr:PD-(D/E)XK nuclease family protein [Candidatus Synoicihabitans palmerolidicus]